MPSHEGNWEKRHDYLIALGEDFDLSECLNILIDVKVNNPEDVDRVNSLWLSQGYEGSIVRTWTGVYREGYRSPDLLKVKQWRDSEYTIVGFTNGKGKFETCPIFKCVTPEGKEFDCAPKGTSAERAELLKQAPQLIGQFLKTKYFTLTPDGIPQFPVGLAIRYKEDI